MVKNDSLLVEGVVTESLPQAQFLITIKTEGFEGEIVRAKVSGKMKMHSIKIVQGDWVKVDLNPYNVGEGRITFRSTRQMTR